MGLLWKLLSGAASCGCKAQKQWYHHRLQPWVHLVPVRADLSDLEKAVVQKPPTECAAIAVAGQALAEQVVVRSTMTCEAGELRASMDISAPGRPHWVTGRRVTRS